MAEPKENRDPSLPWYEYKTLLSPKVEEMNELGKLGWRYMLEDTECVYPPKDSPLWQGRDIRRFWLIRENRGPK